MRFVLHFKPRFNYKSAASFETDADANRLAVLDFLRPAREENRSQGGGGRAGRSGAGEAPTHGIAKERTSTQ